MRITIKDIAREFNLHHSTVSRALRDDPRINPDTKDKIRKYAKLHGYRLNVSALHFRGNIGNVIALLVPNINHRFFSNIIYHLTNLAYQNNFVVSVFQSNESYEQECRIIEKVIEQDVDGVIASASNKTLNGDHFNEFIKMNIPLIFFDRTISGLETSAVINNNQEIVEEMMDWLIKKDRKRIAHLTGPEKTSVFKSRNDGYKNMIQKNKFDYYKPIIFNEDFSMEGGRQVINKLYNEKIKPDAILSNSSYLTIGVIRQLNDMQIRIPEDSMIAGFGDRNYNEMLHPDIISIEQPEEEMAETAFDLLLNELDNKIQNKPPLNKTIKLKSKIIQYNKNIKSYA